MGAVVGTALRRAEGEGASLSMTMTAVMTAKTTTERRVRGQHEQVARRRQEIGRHTVPEQGLGHRVLGTMSIADLGVGRARGSSRAASGSPPGSGQAGYSSRSMPVTGLPGNLVVPAWVLVGNVHVGVQGAGVRACDAALGVSSGGRGHGQTRQQRLPMSPTTAVLKAPQRAPDAMKPPTPLPARLSRK